MVFGGAAATLIIALGVVVWLAMADSDADPAPPPSGGGLLVQVGHGADPRLDPTRRLSCFVGGLPAGEMTVAECAGRNGVAAGALSVGIDQNGALTASKGPTVAPTPEPPASSPKDLGMAYAPGAAYASASPQADQAEVHECWRQEAGDWQASPVKLSLGDCAKELFAGQCVMPGGSVYGRWGGRTVRLVPGRVEVSSEDGSFRTLTTQSDDCANGVPN